MTSRTMTVTITGHTPRRSRIARILRHIADLLEH